jgi:3-deoxy-D-manno-octulosonate 8-phosphate phosphatase (KDO 8-P phosphatase)
MKKPLSTASVQAKLKKIKLVVLDVDGVLTDSRVFWCGSGWSRIYNVKDGFGIKLLLAAGVQVAIISAGSSEEVRERAKMLKIPHVYLGDENKIVAYEDLIRKTGFKHEQVAFVADELFDIPVLEKVGLAITVPDAPEAVRTRAHAITKVLGGDGAVREVVDALRKAQKLGPHF